MTKEALQKAKELNERIDKLHNEINELERPGIILRVYCDEAKFDLLSTIGTDSRCEHPDAEAARRFLCHIIERRQKESSKLHDQFNAL